MDEQTVIEDQQVYADPATGLYPPPVQEVLAQVMRDLHAIPKDKKNEQQGFKYRSIEQVVNELHVAMSDHGLLILPSVVASSVSEQMVGSKAWQSVHLEVGFTFVGPRGDQLSYKNANGVVSTSFVVAGEGVDNGDKATAKAWTNCWKNLLLYVFMIPTQEMAASDIDAYSPGDGEKAAPAAKRPLTDPRDPRLDVLGDNGEVIGMNSPASIRKTQTPAGHTDVTLQQWKEKAGAMMRKLDSPGDDALADFGRSFLGKPFKQATVLDYQSLYTFSEWFKLQGGKVAEYIADPTSWNQRYQNRHQQRGGTVSVPYAPDELFMNNSELPVEPDDEAPTDFDAMFPQGSTHPPAAPSSNRRASH